MAQYQSQVDLHIHSTASDGVFSPSEVVRLALEGGMTTIALTDHDTMAGIVEAQQAARGTDLEVIPGVEVNSEGDGGELHFLGYYVNVDDGSLCQQLQAMRDARVGRARQMIERLHEMGMPLIWEDVQMLASGESVGRPHIARALVDRGYIETVQEAFDRFIARNRPAYIPRLRLKPPEVIEAIIGAGGVPVVAHPAHSGAAVVERIPEFVAYGLRGVEVYYPHHSPKDIETLLGICQAYGLLVTGGTDFHGPFMKEGVSPGSVYVPAECVERLRAECRRQGVAD